jgi:hypothetical protein
VISFHFLGIKILAKFHPNMAKLVKLTLEKHNFPNFFAEKWQNFTRKNNTDVHAHGFVSSTSIASLLSHNKTVEIS